MKASKCKSKRIMKCAIASVLAISLIPIPAFAANVIASSQGPYAGKWYDDCWNVGYSQVEIHTDLYANGFSFIKGNETSRVAFDPGRFTVRTFLYSIVGSEKLLMASGSKTNTGSMRINAYMVNQIWAPAQPINRVETTNIVNASSGSIIWGTNAELTYSLGPTPRSLTENSSSISGTNDSGLAYGSVKNDPYKPEGQPDLIAVIASNGNRGYVYYQNLYEILSSELNLSPEEAVEKFSARDDKMATAIADTVSNHYGVDAITKQDALEGIAKLSQGIDANEIAASLNEKARREIGTIEQLNALTGDDYRMLYDEAMTKVGSILPVYESDGVTQIGQFVIDVV